MAGITIEAQAPIFVFREWHRHRIPFGYNEASARYAPLPGIDYLPTIERVMRGGGHLTKQAGSADGAEPLTEASAHEFIRDLRTYHKYGQRLYEKHLKQSIPKELARGFLTVNRYSKHRATGNLRGWLALITLRDDPTAQWEFQVYAQIIGEMLAAAFPRTWEIFQKGRGR
jgi:thymidylate synthase (FAD)